METLATGQHSKSAALPSTVLTPNFLSDAHLQDPCVSLALALVNGTAAHVASVKPVVIPLHAVQSVSSGPLHVLQVG